MTAIVLGLVAAMTYGAADFLGGLATRAANVVSVILLSQLVGSGLLVLAAPFFLDDGPTSGAIVWGSLAGVAGAIGVGAFYQALALGRMSVVAPITGVEAASIPVLYGLMMGERPSSVSLLGVVVALVAVALVSWGPVRSSDRARTGAGTLLAVVAGVAFGAFFILLSEAGNDAGLWPLLSARAGSLVLIAGMWVVARPSLKASAPVMGKIAGAGVLDVSANLSFLVASRLGLLSLVAVLTSMYPAATVVLARIFLREKLTAVQVLGLGAAAAGVLLIGGG